MASLLDKVGLVSVPHELPAKIAHRRKILIALTGETVQMPDHRSGYFWGELLHAYEVFVHNGWDVDIVSENGTATVDESSIKAPMASAGDMRKYMDKEFILWNKLNLIRPASAVLANKADYAAIYYAGGHACSVDLPKAQTLKTLTRDIYESGGIVGFDCHGIAILENLKLSNGQSLIHGKQVTGFSTKGEEAMNLLPWMHEKGFKTMEQTVKDEGGLWTEHKSNPMAEFVIADTRIVTGMNPASAKKVAQEIVDFLPEVDPDMKEAEKGAVHQSQGLGLDHGLNKEHMGTDVDKARDGTSFTSGRNV